MTITITRAHHETQSFLSGREKGAPLARVMFPTRVLRAVYIFVRGRTSAVFSISFIAPSSGERAKEREGERALYFFEWPAQSIKELNESCVRNKSPVYNLLAE